MRDLPVIDCSRYVVFHKSGEKRDGLNCRRQMPKGCLYRKIGPFLIGMWGFGFGVRKVGLTFFGAIDDGKNSVGICRFSRNCQLAVVMELSVDSFQGIVNGEFLRNCQLTVVTELPIGSYYRIVYCYVIVHWKLSWNCQLEVFNYQLPRNWQLSTATELTIFCCHVIFNWKLPCN